MTLIVVPLSDRPATNLMQGPHRAVVASTSSEADALYAMREDLPNAPRGGGILGTAACEERGRISKQPGSWRGRAIGWGATFLRRSGVPGSSRVSRPGAVAAAAQPNRPDGHFWMAANMGGMAEGFGLRAGLRYRGPSRRRSRRHWPLTPPISMGVRIERWAVGTPGCPGFSAAVMRRLSNIYSVH